MASLSRLGRPLGAAVLLAGIAFGVWRLAGGTAGSPVDLFPSAGSPSASGSPRIVISEFGIEADTLWVAPAGDPSSRQVVAVVPHAAQLRHLRDRFARWPLHRLHCSQPWAEGSQQRLAR